MRTTAIINLIKNNILSILMVVLAGVVIFIELSQVPLRLWINITLVSTIIILNIIENVQKNSDFNIKQINLQTKVNNLELSNKKLEEEQSNLGKEIKKQNEWVTEYKKEKETSLKLLNLLIEKGKIKEEELLNYAKSSLFYSLYFFGPSYPKVHKDYTQPNRLYPKKIEELGFIRMGLRSGYFITTKSRIKRRFKGLRDLKNFVEELINLTLPQEWGLFISDLKKKSVNNKNKKIDYLYFYNKYKEEDYKKYMRMNVIISSTLLNSNNVSIINNKTFKKDFYDLLKEEIDLSTIELPNYKKIEIKRFLCGFSLELLNELMPDEIILKIAKQENKIKSELGILSIFKILKINDNKVALAIKNNTTLNEKDSVTYAKIIKSWILNYKEQIAKLGINMD